ncbi:hypothetical protein CDAR_383111 [Caerostris darwini]|uniref:Uncharacterized protein n=1 Tax=Caerostris darwini TaxID=1538125 RepID=A0AAV4NVK8_9ARAC|nr:hypothetical protein CDAR_383111 [Caerostris darwini]
MYSGPKNPFHWDPRAPYADSHDEVGKWMGSFKFTPSSDHHDRRGESIKSAAIEFCQHAGRDWPSMKRSYTYWVPAVPTRLLSDRSHVSNQWLMTRACCPPPPFPFPRLGCWAKWR